MGLYAFLDERFHIGKFRVFELIDPNWCRWTREGFVPSRYGVSRPLVSIHQVPTSRPQLGSGMTRKDLGVSVEGLRYEEKSE